MFCSKYTPTLEISENKIKHISHLGIFNNNKSYFVFDNFIHVYIMNWDNFLFAWFLFIALLVLISQSKFPLSLLQAPTSPHLLLFYCFSSEIDELGVIFIPISSTSPPSISGRRMSPSLFLSNLLPTLCLLFFFHTKFN